MTAVPILNITSKHTPISLSAKSPYPRVLLVSELPPPHTHTSSYLRWSPLTHLAMGLCCALPNDELCIRRCHFEKCNYLSDKADGPVLSGICCASIKSLVLKKELLTHKQGACGQIPLCIHEHIYMHTCISTCAHTSSLACVWCLWMLLREMTFSKSVKQTQHSDPVRVWNWNVFCWKVRPLSGIYKG